MWELLILLGIIVAVHWWEYSSDVQEYRFAQPATLDRHDELRLLLGEKTPVAVEIGALPWRPAIAEKAGWAVEAVMEGSDLSMPIGEWLSQEPRPPLANPASLAADMGLTTGLAELDGARSWWWLPGLHDASIDILEPDQVLPLTWISAERAWIGCSHGGPVKLWLVHSRYRRFLPADVTDPWSLTVETAPWIGRVQYIEVLVKPGWCIGLPAHWGFAAKADGTAENNSAWIWSADQHSALSYGMAHLPS